jgi:hypothetical protein
MHWPSHCNAFYTQWIVRYLHPRQAPWKTVLRTWIKDEHLQDGILLADTTDSSKIAGRVPKTAPYIKRWQCLSAFADLRLKQNTTDPGDSCAAEPLFTNRRFTVPISDTRSRIWQGALSISRIIDMLDTRSTPIFPFIWFEWNNTFFRKAPLNIRNIPTVHNFVDRRHEDRIAILQSIPQEVLTALERTTHPQGPYAAIMRPNGLVGYVEIEKHNDGTTTLHNVWLDMHRRPHPTGAHATLAHGETLREVELWDNTPSEPPPAYGSAALDDENPPASPPRSWAL